jgi:hypothetical protein
MDLCHVRQQVVLSYSRRRMAAFCVSRAQDTQGDRGWTQWPQGTILTERARQWRCPALATARSRGGHLGATIARSFRWSADQIRSSRLHAKRVQLAAHWCGLSQARVPDRVRTDGSLKIGCRVGASCRSLPTIFDSVACWARATSFRPLQNASSRLTLVLCPSIATKRFMTEDFVSMSPIVCGLRKPQ